MRYSLTRGLLASAVAFLLVGSAIVPAAADDLPVDQPVPAGITVEKVEGNSRQHLTSSPLRVWRHTPGGVKLEHAFIPGLAPHHRRPRR